MPFTSRSISMLLITPTLSRYAIILSAVTSPMPLTAISISLSALFMSAGKLYSSFVSAILLVTAFDVVAFLVVCAFAVLLTTFSLPELSTLSA